MSISAIGPGQSAPVSHERTEGPGPDHDGDGDDSGGAVQTRTPASTAPGTGNVVDKTA
jgi:hypothetical protein